MRQPVAPPGAGGRQIQLKHSIQAYGEDVTVLELPGRVQLRHIRGIDGQPDKVGQLIGLISSMCQIPLSSAEQIDLEDLAAVAEALAPFEAALESFQPAGPESPAT